MDCQETRDLLSDYVEECLVEPDASHVKAHLEGCDACREELSELREMLGVIQGLPREEPAFDLWAEFAPKFAEIRAEMRPGPFQRVRLYFVRIWTALCEGWQLFASAVRYNTNLKLRYLTGGAD